MEHYDHDNVDPTILKKLSAQVTHFHGPRKNLSFVISVEALGANRHAAAHNRDSSQFVARSFEEFRRFRKSLLTRVGGSAPLGPAALFKGASAGHARCCCLGDRCAFDVTKTFIERMQFTRMPFFGLSVSEQDVANRQTEMNNFLRIIFAIVHKMQPSAWQSDCLFLQDILTFLDVEQSFFEQVEEYLKQKRRQLSLNGWKAHTLESFGHGIRTKPT